MKTTIFAFVFIVAVAAFAFPPVVGPDDKDSPEIIIRSTDETGSDEESGDDRVAFIWFGMVDEDGVPNNHESMIVAEGWSGHTWCRTYIFCKT